MIEDFFSNIALYLQSENDLSDVTCAMCHGSVHFKRLFVNFFFPELDVNKVSRIRREVPDEKDMHSRVDLMIEMTDDTLPYLIEVKIYDRQHHFGQYEAAYGVGRERLGYITNYVCHEGISQGYDVKTWLGWYELLSNSLEKIDEAEEKRMCEGYLVYLKKVCGFTERIQAISTSPDVLDELMKDMRSALNNCRESLHIRITSTLATDYTYTFFFTSSKDETEGGWLGIYDREVNPTICIGFQSNLQKSKEIYKRLKHNAIQKNDKWAEQATINLYGGKCIIIPMSKELHQVFGQCGSSAMQIELITGYIEDVLTQL